MCWTYYLSLDGKYNTPTLFILQDFMSRSDFSLEIWYNITVSEVL